MQVHLGHVAISWLRPFVAALPRFSRAGLSASAIVIYFSMLIDLGCDATTILTVAAVAAAAFLSGIAGFAFSAICGAIVFQFRSDTLQVLQIMLACSIANQSLSVWALRRDIRRSALAPFLVGGVFGIPAGIWVLLNLNARAYATALGGVLFLYGTYMLFRKPILLRRRCVAADLAAGFLGGLMGGFAATPGAAVSVWCGMKGWDKVAQRAVFQPFILIMQVLTLLIIVAYRRQGMSAVGFPPTALFCVPAGLAGTWFGLAWFRHLSDRTFRTAVNLLLIVSGAFLVL